MKCVTVQALKGPRSLAQGATLGKVIDKIAPAL